MTTQPVSTQTAAATQVYRVYIKASAQAIWDAITKPEWTSRYGYTGLADYEMRPGGAYRVTPTADFRTASLAQGYPCPDVLIEGEVIEADPPNRLVTTFVMLMDPGTAAEPASRITHEVVDIGNGVCSLTVVHELEGSPRLAEMVSGHFQGEGAGGGHAWILSDLKTLLETGHSFTG